MAAPVTGWQPYLSLPAGSASNNTVGTAADWGQAKADHALYVVTSSGVSAGVVSLELSPDGQNWFTTTTTITTNAASKTFAVGLADFPAEWVRAKITTGITGGSVTAYVASA